MSIKLHDTLSGTDKALLTERPGQVRVPGSAAPSYAWAQVAQVRAQVIWDVLSRHLLASDLRLVRVPDLAEKVDVSADEARAASLRLQRATLEVDPAQAGAREVYERAEPEAVRYFVLSTHYRAPLALSGELDADGRVTRFALLDDAERQVRYLYATAHRLETLPEERIAEVDWKPPTDIRDLEETLAQSLDADLNTPLALAEVTRFLVAVNELCDAALRKHGKVARSHVDDATEGFATIAGRLGVGTDEPATVLARIRDRRAAAKGISHAFVEGKIRERAEARKQKDFPAADAVRAELTQLGVELLDSPAGTTWTIP